MKKPELLFIIKKMTAEKKKWLESANENFKSPSQLYRSKGYQQKEFAKEIAQNIKLLRKLK